MISRQASWMKNVESDDYGYRDIKEELAKLQEEFLLELFQMLKQGIDHILCKML